MKWNPHGRKPTGEPLHLRIYEDLLSKIEDGEFEPGDRLPAESELQKFYGVSRTPVRQALGRLESEGLLIRQPGKGTFVQYPHDVGAWGRLSGFGRYYRDQWDKLVTRTLGVELAQPDDAIRRLLDVGPDEQVVHVRRTRETADKPVVYLEHFLPTDRFSVEPFTEAGHFYSMRLLLKERFGVQERTANEQLEAVPAPAKVAAILDVPPISPLLFVRRLSLDWRRRPIQVIRYYVRTELWKYRINLEM